MDIGKILNAIMYILPFVIVALLIWDNHKLSRRMSKLEFEVLFLDRTALESIEEFADLLDERITALETPKKVTRPKAKPLGDLLG